MTMRLAWIGIGLVFTSVGFAGLILPLLPGTPFFLLAAYAFTRSSPRLLEWLLSLPAIGSAIRDYRAGLGVPRRVKILAITMASSAVSISALLAERTSFRLAVLALGVIGVWYIAFRLPTRERVLGGEPGSETATVRGGQPMETRNPSA